MEVAAKGYPVYSADSQHGLEVIDIVADNGDEQAWAETAHIFQSAWGRALAHLKSVLEGTNT